MIVAKKGGEGGEEREREKGGGANKKRGYVLAGRGKHKVFSLLTCSKVEIVIQPRRS